MTSTSSPAGWSTSRASADPTTSPGWEPSPARDDGGRRRRSRSACSARRGAAAAARLRDQQRLRSLQRRRPGCVQPGPTHPCTAPPWTLPGRRDPVALWTSCVTVSACSTRPAPCTQPPSSPRTGAAVGARGCRPAQRGRQGDRQGPVRGPRAAHRPHAGSERTYLVRDRAQGAHRLHRCRRRRVRAHAAWPSISPAPTASSSPASPAGTGLTSTRGTIASWRETAA